MPSGSHGGSFGSHSSGGSSSGSSGDSWGGRHSSGGGSRGGRPGRPMHWHFGHYHYYIPSGKADRISIVGAICLFLLFIVFALSLSTVAISKRVDEIIVDRDYYLDMIERAEENPEYKKTATITDIFYNRDCEKWYITYSIPYTVEINSLNVDKELSGYTYSIYTREQAREFEIGDTVEVACSSKVITENTDSITMDYKNFPLSADGEYIQTMNSKKIYIVVLCITSLLVVCGIAYIIVEIKKSIRKSTTKLSPEDLLEDEGNNQCKYCGTILVKGKTKCPNCGASQRAKKSTTLKTSQNPIITGDMEEEYSSLNENDFDDKSNIK